MSRVRTFVKKVETAIGTGANKPPNRPFRWPSPLSDSWAITKGVLHKNTVSRKLSRLAARINAL